MYSRPPRPLSPRQGRPAGPGGLGATLWGASSSPTTEKIASAAATIIFSVILRAPASNAPRNTPGNASTLLIWFGKSLRPVATTAACFAATSGWISGSGFDSANTIASGAIVAMISSGATPADPPPRHPEHPARLVQHLDHAAGKAGGIGALRQVGLDAVHIGAVGMKNALGVEHRDARNTHREKEVRDCDACRSRAK